VCFNEPYDFSIKFAATLGDAVNPQFQVLIGGWSLFGSFAMYPGTVLNGDTVEFILNGTPTPDMTVDDYSTVSLQSINPGGGLLAWFFPPPPDSLIYLKGYDQYSVSGPHEFCPGDTVDISASGGLAYTWTAPVDNPNSSTNSVSPNTDTNYLVEIAQAFCTISDTVYAYVGALCDTTTDDTTVIDGPVPANQYAFSPNSDNVNDTFVLDYLEGTSNSVQIFNRYGDLIGDFVNYNNQEIVWDGTYNGIKVPGGTYYFVVEYDGQQSSSGWVQVVE
jgi:gliding motility-associated-like protein